MRAIPILLLAMLIGSALYVVLAQQPANTRSATTLASGSTQGTRPGETATPVADVPIPNVPGKRLVSRVIEYAPGAGTASHRHARSAFIYAYVLSGEIRSQVDNEPARVYRKGEVWFENPGAHHRVSENASATEPARLLAVIVVDVGDDKLTIPDAPKF